MLVCRSDSKLVIFHSSVGCLCHILTLLSPSTGGRKTSMNTQNLWMSSSEYPLHGWMAGAETGSSDTQKHFLLHYLTFLPINLSEQGMVKALFLYKVTQQLPEYGVLFYRVSQEKKGTEGDIILGICAKGIIVYENKNHTRIASLRFQWRETERISAHVS